MSNEIFEINEEELMQVKGAEGALPISNAENDSDFPQIDNNPPG